MDRKQLLQKAENIRANPPAFFQVAGLHELDEVTTVEDHFIKEGKTDTIHFYIIRPASEKKPLPFVVNIHGGGMIRCHGDRDILLPEDWLTLLIARLYLLIIIWRHSISTLIR